MATNGIISIVKEGKTLFKCVAGCDGSNVDKTASALKQLVNPTIDQVYNACINNNFGCKECTIVQSQTEHRCDPDYQEEELPSLYKEKFYDPKFNPRWECGIASHIEIVNYDAERY